MAEGWSPGFQIHAISAVTTYWISVQTAASAIVTLTGNVRIGRMLYCLVDVLVNTSASRWLTNAAP